MRCGRWRWPSRKGAQRLLGTSTLIALAVRPGDPGPAASGAGIGRSLRVGARALAALARIAARDTNDPWMRLAIASGLGDSALRFIPLCLPVVRSPGRAELLAQAASMVGVRRRVPEMAALLKLIDSGNAERGCRRRAMTTAVSIG